MFTFIFFCLFSHDQDASFDYDNFAEEMDEFEGVWDDGEYVYPLISFPQPIPDLLKKEPTKGALKTKLVPSQRPPSSKAPILADESR